MPGESHEQFLRAGMAVVHLPSGWVVRGRLPAVEDLYINGMVPQDLMGVAAKFTAGAAGPLPTASAEEKTNWHRLLRLFVVAFVREVQSGDEWRPITVTIEDTFTMDPRDIDELEYVVLRIKTPDQVSAVWQADRGEITQEAANEIWRRDAAKSLSGWDTFRGFIEGLAGGAGSADVEQSPEQPAAPNRATRRSRTGRGTRSPVVGHRRRSQEGRLARPPVGE